MYYYRARYYDPKSSVFLGVDPMADKYPNISPYAYCSNNPIIKIDPDGKEEEWVEGTDGKPYWNPEVTKTDQSKLKPGERYIGPTYTHVNDNGTTEYGAQDGNKYNSTSLNGIEVKPESSSSSLTLPEMSQTDKSMATASTVVNEIVKGAAYKEVDVISKYAGGVGKFLGVLSVYNSYNNIYSKGGWSKASNADKIKLAVDLGMLFMKSNPYTIGASVGYGILDATGNNPVDIINNAIK